MLDLARSRSCWDPPLWQHKWSKVLGLPKRSIYLGQLYLLCKYTQHLIYTIFLCIFTTKPPIYLSTKYLRAHDKLKNAEVRLISYRLKTKTGTPVQYTVCGTIDLNKTCLIQLHSISALKNNVNLAYRLVISS